MTKITQEMIDHCRKLGKFKIEPLNNKFGLCKELYDKFKVWLPDLIDFSKIAGYSGSLAYPVNGGFNAFFGCTDMWSKETQYGRERRLFCRLVANELERLMIIQNEALI